jgi:hypothetical protein
MKREPITRRKAKVKDKKKKPINRRGGIGGIQPIHRAEYFRKLEERQEVPKTKEIIKPWLKRLSQQ